LYKWDSTTATVLGFNRGALFNMVHVNTDAMSSNGHLFASFVPFEWTSTTDASLIGKDILFAVRFLCVLLG
jgi:hypothetical protein